MQVLKAYVRNNKRQRVGVLIGMRGADGGIIISGSKVHTGVDKFDRDTGYNLALDRVDRFYAKGRTIKLPESMATDVERFGQRCKRYFKTDKIVYPKIIPFVTSCGSC